MLITMLGTSLNALQILWCTPHNNPEVDDKLSTFTGEEWQQREVKGHTACGTLVQNFRWSTLDSRCDFNHDNVLPSASLRELHWNFIYIYSKVAELSYQLSASKILFPFEFCYFLLLLVFWILFALCEGRVSYFVHHWYALLPAWPDLQIWWPSVTVFFFHFAQMLLQYRTPR